MANLTLPYKMTLRPYQHPLWKAMVVDNYLEALIVWHRRAGKDLVTLNIVIAKALQRPGMYLYIAPYYSQIRNIIWEGADDGGRRFLDYIPPEVIANKYESRMTIELKNGSLLKFAGSDNFDSQMGGNPVGIIRTEASLHKPEGWDYLRPILVNNGGWCLHNGCLLEGTRVQTPVGSTPIEQLKVGDRVMTSRGTSTTVRGTHRNGVAKTLRVETASGYSLTTTPNHKYTVQRGLSAEYSWKKAEDLRPGDRVVLTRKKVAPQKTHREAYFLGLMFGDGSSSKNKVVITFEKKSKRDTILPWLQENFKVASYGRHHNINSKELWMWYKELIPANKSYEKIIPEWVLSGTDQIRASFLAGWLDTDGSTAGRQTKVCTTSKIAAEQGLQLMLSLGVKATLYHHQGKQSKTGLVQALPKTLYNLEAYGKDSFVLLETIPCRRLKNTTYEGRMSGYPTGISGLSNPRGYVADKRIVNMSEDRIKLSERSTYAELDWAMSGFFTEEVVSIRDAGERPTFDIMLDSPFAYIAEGFRVHNTPRGMNHFYTLMLNARKDPGCFFQILTCEDTGRPTKEQIQREREKGVPESIIQQEYYCSFLASSEMTLIPLDIIEPCINTVLTPEDYNFEPRIIGVDVAFAAKGDQTIIAKRQGRMLFPLRKFKGLDNMRLASEIAKEIDAWKPHAVMIDAGRGEGVISRLYQLGYEDLIFPVNFGGAAGVNELYANKRAEIWTAMRDWIYKGIQTGAKVHIPADQNLITGLSTPLMDTDNARGKVQLESKKQIRMRGAYCMDEPDAVAVTFAEPIQGDNPTPGHYGRLRDELNRVMDEDEYDPTAGYDPQNYFNRGDD